MFEDKYVKDKKFCKVRNHCHYTGEYITAAHNTCNLRYNKPKQIPIVSVSYSYSFLWLPFHNKRTSRRL